jgi:hypothetical protein
MPWSQTILWRALQSSQQRDQHPCAAHRRRPSSNPGPGFACRLKEPLRLRRQAHCSTESRDPKSSHVIRTRPLLSPPSSAARSAVAARRALSPADPRTADVSPQAERCATADNQHPARAPARAIPAWAHARERDVLERVLLPLRADTFVLCALANSAAIPNGNEEYGLQSPAMGAERGNRRGAVCAAHACRDESAPGCYGHGRYVCLGGCLFAGASFA